MTCEPDCTPPRGINDRFRQFAICVARFAGSPIAFTASFLIIIAWAILGPFYHFSDTWQLVINTSTTIVTFLMVFLIQNMQNRDAKAIHLKLDELIRAIKGARNNLVMLEDMSEEELNKLENQFQRVSGRRKEGEASKGPVNSVNGLENSKTHASGHSHAKSGETSP